MSQSDYEAAPNSKAGSYGAKQISPPPTGLGPMRRFVGIIVVLITLLLIIVLLFFFPRPTATVTLTPISQTVSNTAMTSVVTRALSSTQQDSQTGTSTGQPKPGAQAVGTLTFKNYTPLGVTIPKGTIVTDVTGQQVVTDIDVFVPGDPPLVPGVAAVSAHAIKVGKSGNIQAMSLNKQCCFVGIYVYNEAAFNGGVDDQTAHTIQQGDIDNVVNALKTSLAQKVLNDLKVHLTTGEQLVNATPQCAPKAATSAGVGESVETFTVNVSLTCSDSAYNPQTAILQTENALKQMALQRLGSGFALVGNIVTNVEQVTPGKNGAVDVLVSAKGIWRYQFTTTQKLDMAKHIARTAVVDAKAWLLQQKGVANVTLSVRGPIIDLSGGKNVSDDLRAITING